MMGSETYYNILHRGQIRPLNEVLTLKTQTRVWDIILGEKLGYGARGVVWRANGKNGERKISGLVKSYNSESVGRFDKLSTGKLIDRNIETHAVLKRKGIPTIPTMQKINETDMFVTDLTENGKYRVLALNNEYYGKIPYFGKNSLTQVYGRLFYKNKLREILLKKLQILRENIKKNDIKIPSIDVFFFKIPTDYKDISDVSVSILIGDLDNIDTKIYNTSIPYDDEYLVERFLRLLN